MTHHFYRILACEIALREIAYAVARSPNIVDLEFVSQGLHDHPQAGREELQRRVDAVPAGRYNAVLIGYALCGNIVNGLKARHTPLVVPRAHDCITFFLGSRERYQSLSESLPGAYYYTAGWMECLRRRGEASPPGHPALLPTRAGAAAATNATYEHWVAKYGEDSARHLLEVMNRWTENYTHGVFIDFDFARTLHLREQVQNICAQRGWQFEEVEGDLRLLQRWVDGEWDPESFLVVPPRHEVVASYDDQVIRASPSEQPVAEASGRV
jgi:hypothetical protein